MIIGIGIDIAQIKRIAKNSESDAFQRTVFTSGELETCKEMKKRAQCLAGKFAAKEAFMKALGRGIRQAVWFTQIEVLNHETGAPYIQVTGEAERRLKELQTTSIHVSISHDHRIATAVVILEK